MQRSILILLLSALLIGACAAQAETWFPDSAGTLIHRDPFCPDRTLTLDSYVLPSRQYASKEEILREGAYAVCDCCDILLPAEAASPLQLYYNPDGGERLHHDPDCPSVSARYRPMVSADNVPEQQLPAKLCSICAILPMQSPSDTHAWNADLAEKARILPGIWTTTSEHALSAEEAYFAALDWMANHLPDRVYSICPMHYDHGMKAGDLQESYKIIVTTALRHPVCVLYMDAISGEIYGIERSAEFLYD